MKGEKEKEGGNKRKQRKKKEKEEGRSLPSKDLFIFMMVC